MLYIFCSFTLLVCGKKNILPNLTNSQEPEPGVFGSLSQSRSRLKKYRSRSRLGKKSGAGAAWKKVRSRSQPWKKVLSHVCRQWTIHIKYLPIKFERYKVRNKIVRLYKTWSRTKRRRSTTCRMSRTTNVYSYQRKFRTTPNGLRRYKLRCIARKFPWGFSRVFKDLSLLKNKTILFIFHLFLPLYFSLFLMA